MTIYDAGNPIASLRKAIRTTVQRSPFSGLNFLFSDGDRLFAYRLGLFELHWLHRPGQLLVASERVTDEALAHRPAGRAAGAGPRRPRAPHAERLLGDELLAEARVQKVDRQAHLRGEARGEAAAERARAAVADS